MMSFYQMFIRNLNMSILGFYLPVEIYDLLQQQVMVIPHHQFDAFWFSIPGQIIKNPGDDYYRELQFQLSQMMVNKVMSSPEFDHLSHADNRFLSMMLTSNQIKARYPNKVDLFRSLEYQIKMTLRMR